MYLQSKILKWFLSIFFAGLTGSLIFFWWWNNSQSIFSLQETVITADGEYSLASELPVPRTESGGTAYDGKFYILGGIDNLMQTMTSFMVYDPKTDTWSELPGLPQPINHPAVVANDNKIYVVGGFNPLKLNIRWFMFADWDPLSTVYIFDLTTNTWSLGKTLPEPRGSGGIAIAGNSIWYSGGIDQNKKISASLFRMNLTTGEWNVMPEMSVARDHLRMEAVHNKLYAISGREDDLRHNIKAVEVFDISTLKWSRTTDIPVGRGGFASAVIGTDIYTFGGEYTWTCLEQVERFNTLTSRWEILSGLPEGRHGIIAGVIDSQIHLVSGGRHPRVSISGIHRVYKPNKR